MYLVQTMQFINKCREYKYSRKKPLVIMDLKLTCKEKDMNLKTYGLKKDFLCKLGEKLLLRRASVYIESLDLSVGNITIVK